MNFDMLTPCAQCPFIKGSNTNKTLAKGRIEDIVEQSMDGYTFTCHKTLELPKNDQQHCAGAMLYLERENRPNQMMRIAERLGMYDHRKLKPCENLIDPIATSEGDE